MPCLELSQVEPVVVVMELPADVVHETGKETRLDGETLGVDAHVEIGVLARGLLDLGHEIQPTLGAKGVHDLSRPGSGVSAWRRSSSSGTLRPTISRAIPCVRVPSAARPWTEWPCASTWPPRWRAWNSRNSHCLG